MTTALYFVKTLFLFIFLFFYQFGKEIKQLVFSMKGFIERAYLIFWMDLLQLSFKQRGYLLFFNMFYRIRAMPQADKNDSILRIMSNWLPKSTSNSQVPAYPHKPAFPGLWRMLAPGSSVRFLRVSLNFLTPTKEAYRSFEFSEMFCIFISFPFLSKKWRI